MLILILQFWHLAFLLYNRLENETFFVWLDCVFICSLTVFIIRFSLGSFLRIVPSIPFRKCSLYAFYDPSVLMYFLFIYKNYFISFLKLF